MFCLLLETILRLRTTCAPFGRRVGGAAAFEAANLSEVELGLPFGFVVPVGDDADVPDSGNPVAQMVTYRFAVIVVMDNTVDKRHGRGLQAYDDMTDIRPSLQTSLMGWEPFSRPTSPVRYVGSAHIGMNDAQLYHQYDYQVSFLEGPDNEAAGFSTVKDIYGRYKGWEPDWLLDSSFDREKHVVVSHSILDVLVDQEGQPIGQHDPQVFFRAAGKTLARSPSQNSTGNSGIST